MGSGAGLGSAPPGARLTLGPALPGLRSRAVVGFGIVVPALVGMWLLGLALQLRQPVLWPLARYGWLLGLGLLLALCVVAPWRWRARPHARARSTVEPPSHGPPSTERVAGACDVVASRAVLALVAIALVAFGQCGLRASLRAADALPAVLHGQDLQLEGVVAAMPQSAGQGVRFVFEVDSARWQGEAVRVPSRVSLGWWRGWGEEVQGAPPWEGLAAGQRWRLTARLRPPHGLLNPGGFDTELWLFEQGLRATGSVHAVAQRLDTGWSHPVERLRQAVRDAVLQAVPDGRAAGVLAALAVGDQGAIEREDWELFRVTGVAHLMSISGLHVTMFAWLAGAAIGAVWRRSPRAALWCATPVAARWGGVAAAAGYALLAGWGVPAQRTVWMLVAVAALRSGGRHWPWPLVLAVAAALVTLLDPWALLQPGFWLSFGAVALLIASEERAAHGARPAKAVHRWRTAAWAGLRTQLVATVGLAPLTLVFFQQLSLIGAVANLLAVPLVTLAITPLALLGVALPPLWAVGAALVQGLCAVLQGLATVPGALWTAGAAATWAQLAGLVGGVLVVLPLPWRVRLLGTALLLPLLWPAPALPPPGRFEAVALDVGQGSAVLVRTHAHLLVYDTGPQTSPQSDAAQRVLLPVLRWRGERAVDLLVVSHGDQDHAGGAATLLAHWPVRALASSLPHGHALRARGLPHVPCAAGEGWQWDGVRFDWLHPSPRDAMGNGEAARPNALSCVLRVTDAQGRRLLLTGDIEAAQERELVQSQGEAGLGSDVLLVPHHGSRTSSTEEFLHAVAPHTGVVQAGFRNRYGHPAGPVVQRYEARGIALRRSDQCGAWHWDGERGECERERVRRYWHHTP